MVARAPAPGISRADRGPITPFATVVHTTDMVPEAWHSLVNSWTTQRGPGDCAHFAIERDADAGLVQFAPIGKNASHAGGNGHGSFVAGSQSWHPNTVSVGIEIHCAGCVAKSIEKPPAYGIFATGRAVGHVSLHAAQRGDPWPPTCDWIRARP